MCFNIVMQIHQFRPVCAGAELQAERLASKLVERGCRVEVLTKHLIPETPPSENINGVLISRIKPSHLGYRVNSSCVDNFKELMKRRDCDIVHNHMLYGHVLASVLFAEKYNKKCIFKIAGYDTDLKNFSKFFLGEAALKIIRDRIDAAVAISSTVRQELIQYGFDPERVILIPNGVDHTYFRRMTEYHRVTKREPFHFLMLGRRGPEKGIDIIVQAVRILRSRRISGFAVDLYGADVPGFNYQKQALDAGVADMVHFHPFCHETLPLLERTNCLLLPSRVEGLSNVMLEAMSMELPVICAKVSGCIDVVQHEKNGLLIDTDAPEQLADSMEELIRDEALCERLRFEARQRILSAYTLDVVADSYLSLYRKILSGQNIHGMELNAE